jgi:hypothetical protein
MSRGPRLTRRALLGSAAAAALGAAGCGGGQQPSSTTPSASASPSAAASTAAPASAAPTTSDPPPEPAVQLIGDGSTANTGPQPNQPEPRRLAPGEPPPQFVVFSWDGAANLDTGLFPRFRSLANEVGASMTFFLSGLYALPEDHRMLYSPPQHPVGSSSIGFLSTQEVLDTMSEVRLAWLDGHEIGTHFNGHFCAAGGVSEWTPEDWASEIAQAKQFVQTWKTNTGRTDLPPLPFDYDVELIGSRTPCLEGQEGLLPTAAALGWAYDASAPGGQQVWPGKKLGLWDFPLPIVPFAHPDPGKGDSVLAMDYNIMYKQSDGDLSADPARYDDWRAQARDAYLAGFERAYSTNRAPYFVGNHFEQWNGGIYMDAVEDAVRAIAGRPEVQLVSFRQLVAWLEVQDPAVLDKLRTLPVGAAPTGGWGAFLG